MRDAVARDGAARDGTGERPALSAEGRGRLGWTRTSRCAPRLARETSPDYPSTPPDPPGSGATDPWISAGSQAPDEQLGPRSAETDEGSQDPVAEQLRRNVEVLASRSIDGFDEPALRDELAVVDEVMRRLDARRCRLTAAIVDRERRRARAARPGDARAGERAARRTQSELGDRFQWAPGEAKRATKVGEQATRTPQVGAALDEGALTPRHATLLADTLRWLEPSQIAEAEDRLVAAARTEDPVTFGRTCRRLLAELDHDAAATDQERRHGRRSLRIVDTDDGMTRISGQLAGLDAETLHTAIHSFRRHDAPGEHRQPEQATADALTDALSTALRSSDAPRKHGIPTQVIVTMDEATLRRGTGSVEGQWAGPMPFDEAARVLDDCSAGRLVLDADELPTEVSSTVRTVPAGLWRALVHRDGGCIAEGCNQPAQWCQVMHLETPHHLGGRLRLAKAALGCTYHHRRYDKGRLDLTWHQKRPVLVDPRRGAAATDAPRVTTAVEEPEGVAEAGRPPVTPAPPTEPDTPPTELKAADLRPAELSSLPSQPDPGG